LTSIGSDEKGFYGSLTPEVRKIAAKDAAKIIGVGLAVMAMASMAGADVDREPDSPTFGYITFPNGIILDIFGENASIVRNIIKLFNAGIGGESKKDALLQFGQFVRSKLHPLPRIAVDMIKGKDYMGEHVYERRSLKPRGEWMQNQLTPMAIKAVVEQMERDPLLGLFLLPSSLTGLPIKDKRDFEDLTRRKEAEAKLRKRMDKRDPVVRREKEEEKRKKRRRDRMKL
jgi:hypothetical protein